MCTVDVTFWILLMMFRITVKIRPSARILAVIIKWLKHGKINSSVECQLTSFVDLERVLLQKRA
jgi:hypothetical protein